MEARLRAMRFVGVNSPMEMKELPDPDPRPGWVVLEVVAAGLCHSDLYILNGGLKDTMSTDDGTMLQTTPPITLGHEIAGRVRALGDGVEGLEVGERVISGGPMMPHASPGLTIDGGFAELVAIPRAKVQRIPEGVSFEAAAVATDSVATAFSAVRTSGALRAGETVGIVGLGGLGLNGVRTGALCGGVVYGVDIDTGTFDAAIGLGAQECFTDIADLAPLRPNLIVDFAGTGETTRAALRALAPGGRVVLVGMAADVAPVDTHRLILGGKMLRGSLGRTADDMLDVLDLMAKGELQPVVTAVPFEELNEHYAQLERGAVVGRLVTHPGAHSSTPPSA
jgi:alcohol dehydrogenase, propanol-preferring